MEYMLEAMLHRRPDTTMPTEVDLVHALRDAAAASTCNSDAASMCALAAMVWWNDVHHGSGLFAAPDPALAEALRACARAWRKRCPLEYVQHIIERRHAVAMAMGMDAYYPAIMQALRDATTGTKSAEAMQACAMAVTAWWDDVHRGSGPFAAPDPNLAEALHACAQAWQQQRTVEYVQHIIERRHAVAMAMGMDSSYPAIMQALRDATTGTKSAEAMQACAMAVTAWWDDVHRGSGPFAAPDPDLAEALHACAQAWRRQKTEEYVKAAMQNWHGATMAMQGDDPITAEELHQVAANAKAQGCAGLAGIVTGWWKNAKEGSGPFAAPDPNLAEALHACAKAWFDQCPGAYTYAMMQRRAEACAAMGPAHMLHTLQAAAADLAAGKDCQTCSLRKPRLFPLATADLAAGICWGPSSLHMRARFSATPDDPATKWFCSASDFGISTKRCLALHACIGAVTAWWDESVASGQRDACVELEPELERAVHACCAAWWQRNPARFVQEVLGRWQTPRAALSLLIAYLHDLAARIEAGDEDAFDPCAMIIKVWLHHILRAPRASLGEWLRDRRVPIPPELEEALCACRTAWRRRDLGGYVGLLLDLRDRALQAWPNHVARVLHDVATCAGMGDERAMAACANVRMEYMCDDKDGGPFIDYTTPELEAALDACARVYFIWWVFLRPRHRGEQQQQ